MKVEVTAKDIAEGIQGKAQYCPVARAICRATGHIVSVNATHWYDIVTGETKQIPKEVGDAIDQYDHTGKMAPFTFNLPD